MRLGSRTSPVSWFVFAALCSCGGDGVSSSEYACDFPTSGVCSELLDGKPSLDCKQRGGEPVGRCAEGSSTSCDAETRDGTYHFFGYDVDQETLDARCEAQRQAIGAPSSKDLPQGACSWSIEGDEASGLGSKSGTCYLHGFSSNGLSFRDGATGRDASISTLDFNFFLNSLPSTLEANSGNGQLSEFQLSILGRVTPGASASNWYCSYISGRTEPRGDFRVRLERFALDANEELTLTRYEGSVQAECPAAGEPAAGSITVKVKFSGERK